MDTRPAADDYPELDTDLGHVGEPSGVRVKIEVTALPLLLPAPRIIAEDLDLAPRLADADDDYVPQPDASPAMECLSPGLAPPVTAVGASETKAGIRLVDAVRKPLRVSTSGEQHF